MQALLNDIAAISPVRRFGRAARIEGLLAEITSAAGTIRLCGQVRLTPSSGKHIPCEMVGFRDGRARAYFDSAPAALFPASAWYGKDALRCRAEPYPLKANPPPAASRMRSGGEPDLRARAMNAFPPAAMASPCRRERRSQ
ncbi:MAG TPA: hypothetical protein VJ476_10600 [Rhizomicrobium sp.]|nr:hypothetical protein [Rhizomicrobium sp.]